MIEDVDKLETTLKDMQTGLFGPVTKQDGFNQIVSVRDSFMLAWNKTVLAGIPLMGKPVSSTYIHEILNIASGKNSFGKQKIFAQVRKTDALAWFYTKKINTQVLPRAVMKGYVNMDSSLRVYATDRLDMAYPDFQQQTHTGRKNMLIADTGKGPANPAFELACMLHLPEKAAEINELHFDQYQKTFSLDGTKYVKNEEVSYVYDDNFNKTKVVKTRIDTIYAATLCLFDPLSKKSITISNDPGSSCQAIDFTGKRKLSGHFNQDLLSGLSPLMFFYDVWFEQVADGRFNQYYVSVRKGRWELQWFQ